ncbi:MAG TPA: TRAFs-binding domain-containing protein [Nitrososphaeraceae archaeon]|nr:TRAFs-binding domain-containing protein [Nitrososphaeraceae archaeon]
MPFGKKADNGGLLIDFDSVYNNLIFPAIEEAGLKPIRADEEKVGGVIHKPMFERLILCEYAVVDLTTANPNVFYELGVRHAVRPYSTVLLFAEGTKQLPFDIAPLHAIPYKLDSYSGKPDQQANNKSKEILKRRLIEAQNPNTDSPIFQLVEGFPDIQHIKTDVFRERVNYSEELKKQLAQIRREKNIIDLRNFVLSLKDIKNQEAGVIIDIFLSYRALAKKKEEWEEMAEFVTLMPEPLYSTTLVQEQYAFALNRAGHSEEAERILLSLIEKKGPSSETYGILGRVYKDRWEKEYNKEERQKGNDKDNNESYYLSDAYLDQAIDAYLKGFESDWRDTYPGINAVTLMEIKKNPDPKIMDLIPVVKYSVERKITKGKPDYWDYATLLELAILAKNKETSFNFLSKALSHLRERWEGETTLRNLRTIRKAREKRNELVPWTKKIEEAIQKKID